MTRLMLTPLLVVLLAGTAMARPARSAPPLPDEPFIELADARARLLHRVRPKQADRLEPFGQHTMNAGFGLGLGRSDGGFSMGIGGTFGYFVIDGLEPGVDLSVTFGEDDPVVVSLMGYLRWVFWRAYPFSPFLKVQGGRWFITDWPDISVVGGGGGFVYFLSRWAGLQAEVLVLHLIPDEGACPDDTCTVPSFGLSFGFFFGG